MWVGPKEELMLLKCGAGEDSWESLGLQGDQISQSPNGNQSWIFIGNTDAEAETLVLQSPDVKNWLILEKTLMLGRLKALGEGHKRGWGGWMASLTQQTWLWADSRRWLRTGKLGVLQFIGSQRAGWLSNWPTTIILKVQGRTDCKIRLSQFQGWQSHR